MSKRNAIRLGNPHSGESVAYAVERYGKIEPETLAEIVAWLDKHKNEYSYELKEESIIGEEGLVNILTFPTIKTNRKGSAIFKIIDNEHDAQNTLANIRNKDFPKNKQGR